MENSFIKRHPLVLIVLLNLALSLPGLWVPYYNLDEITNAMYARFILDGTLGLKDFLGNTYILTHYLYVLVGSVFGFESLAPMHAVHALWKCLTILALFWAGTELADKKVGLWSALFYCVGSFSFLSKDFHTPSAESFSLLPAALAAGAFFRALRTENAWTYFAAGALAGVAALFKAPMGITILAIFITLVVRFKKVFKSVFFSHGGFALALLFQGLLVWPWPEGFRLIYAKVEETNANYIGAFEGLSYLYWMSKYIIRTALVSLALFGIVAFALQSFRTLFRQRTARRERWLKILFLFLWLFFLGYAVSLGGRVFYHYYVFLLVPLALLAGAGLADFDTRLAAYARRKGKFKPLSALGFVRMHIFAFLLVPALGFSIEGALNFSTRPPKIAEVVQYVKDHTAEDERIYVWGEVPALYFFSGRQPSTAHFWSEFLAGTSPGTPAMEYIRATGRSLTLSQQVLKDFQAQVFKRQNPGKIDSDTALFQIGENELFTVEELLARIDHPYWKKVFKDFFLKPPVLFIDTSPTNIRGFGHTPITRYELLKRFVLDNYRVVAIKNDMVIYKLNAHQNKATTKD